MPEPYTNPFATRFIRPGAIAFQFPPGESLESLGERLQQSRLRGEIVGPHGSGKSTLVRSLIPHLTSRGVHVTLFTLRQGARGLPVSQSEDVEWFPPHPTPLPGSRAIGKLWIVDGAEQLSHVNLWRLKWSCWWQRRGLVLTTHRPLGLPKLWQTSTSPELAERLVSKLLGNSEQELISRNELEKKLSQQEGNLRELFLQLYDLHQARNHHR